MSELLTPGNTIAAIATAIVPQQGSVGIVRISGSEAMKIAKTLFHAPGKQVWETHRILYGYICHPQTGQLVDEALLLIMKGPRSYTREDIIELHCHGGIIVIQEVLQLCIEAGARLARSGEFTLRAFLNGRLDLTQAESIADLVGSQSLAAAQVALAGLQGKLANLIGQLRASCLDILAEIEARVDFEEDLPPLEESEISQKVDGILVDLSIVLATASRGELLRNGLKVAIIGRPNVGKSSLLNAWSRCDRAIVTDLPGTTRDLVESHLVVGGIPVQVLDTAGIRETENRVEKIGVQRSFQASESADIVLLTIDGQAGWTELDEVIYQQVKHRFLILIINKIDLVQPELIQSIFYPETIKNVVTTAAINNQGIEELEAEIINTINLDNLQAENLDFAVNQRQAAALTRAKVALEQCLNTIKNNLPLDFWTIDLREAIYALGEVTGEDLTESVLDIIFSRFCIGK
ncbi:MAG: tRNA uridine-5-carboxymethylaminomethyl(34) synthesis GTPase MnmE [Trichodesmium sp. MAG_R04]|nr:tRNA uridine-5-carboxymethylaminomethyl(34) synthesis GTPase MnmE [Trichodesmium sp. MAG_R04]